MFKILKAFLLVFFVISSNLSFANLKVLNRSDGQVDTLDPHKAEGVPAINVIEDLYEGLMAYDNKGNIVLGAANKYQISQDGLVYTFYLRDNLKWSNGQKLSAEDFVYSIKRSIDPKTAGARANVLFPIKNAEKILNGELDKNKLGVKALGNNIIQISLEYKAPLILEVLSNTVSFPVYKPSIDKYGNKFTQPEHHVTNGGFKLKNWTINSHLELAKNEYYWDANNVRLDIVKYFDIEQPMQEFRRYQSGQIDTTSNIPTENINYIKRLYKSELLTGPYMAVYYYGFNVTNPPMDNKYLREALFLAVDRKIITDKLLRMGEIPQQYLMPNNTKNYKSPKISTFELNDEQRVIKAQKAYEKSGYSKNNPVTVTILYNTMDSHKQIAVLIAAMWKSVLGVKTELINAEWKVFLKPQFDLRYRLTN